MITPTPAQPDKVTPAELRAAFQTMTERLDQIETRINEFEINILEVFDSISKAATAAASQPQAAAPAAGQTVEFLATALLVGIDDNGQPTYKAKGGQYAKFGVRIWPETLPALGVDPGELKPGPNPVNLHVLALMGDKGPRKVIGLAK
jgi:hypothetical protein